MTFTDDEQLSKFLNSFDRQVKALRHDLLRITWSMRGGITYDQAAMLSPGDREIIGDIIEENAEVTKKTGHPYF